MTATPAPSPEIHRRGPWLEARFTAMGGPGRIFLHHPGDGGGDRLQAALAEIRRIEAKFSRFRRDSVVGRINAGAGAWITVDEETADLLDYAATCHRLSDGLFDITAGLLARTWPIHGQRRPPPPEAVAELLPRVGWQRVDWHRPRLRLAPGMAIDLGGIGKEYAVDRALARLEGHPALVELAGDLAANAPTPDGPWPVALADPNHPGRTRAPLPLTSGALATSGDAERSFTYRGRRYSHLLDPRDGRPVRGAPRSVTVHAPTCLEAGTLATLAMLHGVHAEAFLAAQGLPHWCLRDDVPESRPFLGETTW